MSEVHLHIHQDDRVSRQLDALFTLVKQQGSVTMASIAEIKIQSDKALAAIAAESTLDDSIIGLVTANTAQIAGLKDQLAAAIAAGANPADLQAVMDAFTAAETSSLANAAKVSDALTANVPVA